MPQAGHFLALILFHRKSFPDHHGISERGKEGEGKGFSDLPCSEKTPEPGKKPPESVCAQQTAAANTANPREKPTSWNSSGTGEQAPTSMTSVQFGPHHTVTGTRAETPPAVSTGRAPPERASNSPHVTSVFPLTRVLPSPKEDLPRPQILSEAQQRAARAGCFQSQQVWRRQVGQGKQDETTGTAWGVKGITVHTRQGRAQKGAPQHADRGCGKR